jgi:hypothetical protein
LPNPAVVGQFPETVLPDVHEHDAAVTPALDRTAERPDLAADGLHVRLRRPALRPTDERADEVEQTHNCR